MKLLFTGGAEFIGLKTVWRLVAESGDATEHLVEQMVSDPTPYDDWR